MPSVTYIINGQKKTVTGDAGKTILQIALDNGIGIEHACGGNGFCTTCMCKVTENAASLSPRNDREDMMGIEGDNRLGCQAQVEGDATVEVIGS
jgi:ferredoxin